MNIALSRDLVAQLVIMLACTIGAWMIFVEPATNELHRLEAEIAVSLQEPSISQATVENAAARVTEVRKRVREIQDRNALTQDTGRLYGRIMDLADTHRVTVRQLQPSNDRRRSAEGGVELGQLVMTVEGQYDQLATFLDAIDSIGGFVRPSSLQLTPLDRHGERLARARITCDTITFTLNDALGRLESVSDAQR